MPITRGAGVGGSRGGDGNGADPARAGLNPAGRQIRWRRPTNMWILDQICPEFDETAHQNLDSGSNL